MKTKYFITYIFVVFFPIPTFATSLGIVEQVEKNLIYNNDIKKKQAGETLIINRGGWSDDAKEKIEDGFGIEEKSKAKAEITKRAIDERSITTSRKAYDALTIGQIEVAIEYYKNILKEDKTNNYALLGLATSYHQLGQYRQAKPLYLRLLEVFPGEEEIMVNLLSIVTEETPYEAVYLLSSMAEKNPNSPLIQAQTSIAYSNIGEYDKAIEYIEKALMLDNKNIQYMYNLAVLFDMKEDYRTAYSLYTDLINYTVQNNAVNKIPYKVVLERSKLLEQYI